MIWVRRIEKKQVRQQEGKDYNTDASPVEEKSMTREDTHILFGSRCKYCAFGQARSHPYHNKDKSESGAPTVSRDSMWEKAAALKYEDRK